MSFIKDIQGSIETGFNVSERVGFDVPLVIGRTGQRSVLTHGSGTSAIRIKSVSRGAAYNIVIQVTGSTYEYAIDVYGENITITVPTTNTAKALVAAYASAPAEVKAAITIEAISTGSGSVAALSSTAMGTLPVYQQIVDLEQVKHYYDSDDDEYVIVEDMLGGSGTHITNLYLLDTYGIPSYSLAATMDVYNDGKWWAGCLANIDSTEAQALADWFSNEKRLLFLVTDDVNELATVQGRVVYNVHPTAKAVNHPEASWMAKGLVPAPGSSDWAGISDLHNQTPDESSTLTELLAVRAENGNSYIKQSGNSFMQDGRVNQVGASNSSPVYIADIMFQDWLVLNMEVDLLNLKLAKIKQGLKINYDDQGIREVVAVIANRLRLGAQNGGIAVVSSKDQASQSYDGEYRYNVEAPTRAQVETDSPGDIVLQILKNVKFWYVKSGTIQKITFSGLELLTEPGA